VQRFLRLANPIRHYAWGSHTALAELQGRRSPAAEPEAELWIGAHPVAPSCVQTREGPVPLDRWIAASPSRVLGADLARRFEGELPFLLKILAVERPLSLQAHPDAKQAREGFARDEAKGMALDAPARSYRDPRPKPELVCALRPFKALYGFREPAEIVVRFRMLGVSRLASWLDDLERQPDADGWKRAFAALYDLPPEARAAVVLEAARAAARVEAREPSLAWVRRLAEAYPGDLGALAPVYLHEVALDAGEALYVGAGELHCYLSGFAVEVMANSDNVLRGGLTSKHVDVEELLRVLRFEVAPPRFRPGEDVNPSVRGYRTPAREFDPAEIALGEREALTLGPELAVLLAGEGEPRLEGPGGEPLALSPGEAALVTAGDETCTVRGAGRLYRVRVPSEE